MAFKGGTALSKCYLNYHRFSMDLDFTYIHDENIKNLSKSKRNKLNKKIREKEIIPTLKDVEKHLKPLGYIFQYPLDNRGFMMGNDVFSASYRIENNLFNGEIRVEFNLGEEIYYDPKIHYANTLLNVKLGEYVPIKVLVYNPREILGEKYKAMLTRIVWRDYFDTYFLQMLTGSRSHDLESLIITKGARDLRRKMLRNRFCKVRDKLWNLDNILINLEKSIKGEMLMILRSINTDIFDKFVISVLKELLSIMDRVEEKYITERIEDILRKYAICTQAGCRAREKLLKKNKDDYQFYLAHKSTFEDIISKKSKATDIEMER